MSNTIDTDVDNYTITELLVILNLDNNNEPTAIEDKTNYYIDKFETENNQKMATFFRDIQNKLLQYQGIETQEEKFIGDDYYGNPVYENPKVADQTNEWYQNENLTQNNQQQNKKTTDRKQKIDVYQGNDHMAMNQEQLGVNNVVNVPFAQDSLNPTLKNTTERFIILDSQYRQSGEIATDYTLDLSEQLKDVLSLRLYSFQIPVTWYTIDVFYGNTCFWITNEDLQLNIPVSIESGNYTQTTIVTSLNTAFTNAGFTYTTNPVYYDEINGKITINIYGATYTDPSYSFIVDDTTIITFFDYTAKLKCADKCSNIPIYSNQTLGWILGYRDPAVFVKSGGNIANSVINLNGPKYLILVIDDYNQNRVNNGLVSITELSKTLKVPTYYSPDLPYVCVDPQNQFNIEKSAVSYGPYPQMLPSAPRTLTQSQIYTINEIIKNNEQNTNYKIKAPTNTDVFGILPVKSNIRTGDMYVELSGSLQDLKRTYFGPVNIDRMRIKLLDDKGNVLNLNGCDWSIILISENLYQY
jgi:hypothetical protein